MGTTLAILKQLTCLGIYCDKAPDMVQCSNESPDGIIPHWKCNAVIDESVKFGYLNVQCEGYESPYDNKYIYPGSCGLKYYLEPVNIEKDKGGDGDSLIGILMICLIPILMVKTCGNSSESYEEGVGCGILLSLLCGRPDETYDSSWSDISYTCIGVADTSFR